MIQCHSLPPLSGDLKSIMTTTAAPRRRSRRDPCRKRRMSRRQSHQLSVDNDILTAGRDLREKVLEEGVLIKTCTYLDRDYLLAFKGEELLHWMVTNCWAVHAMEAISIAQILLTHNLFVNISDNRDLMTFKKLALYRFHEDEERLPPGTASSNADYSFDSNFDKLYRKLWSDWVLRSRVIGWWLYTNTLTGSDFVSWLTSSHITNSREEAQHFATQLFLANFLIRIYPTPTTDRKGTEFTDDDTIYQVNVCCNQTVDSTTKVFHTLAHAIRLCSVDSEDCMYYGKSDLPESVFLEQFELETDGKQKTSLMDIILKETSSPQTSDCYTPPDRLPSVDESATDQIPEPSQEDYEASKCFLQAVSRAYYPSFTSVVEDSYFSYQEEYLSDPESCITDAMFHSFQLTTHDEEDSIVIEYEQGVDLQDMSRDPQDLSCAPSEYFTSALEPISETLGLENFSSIIESIECKPRSCTLDLVPTPRDASLQFQKTKLQLDLDNLAEIDIGRKCGH